ncbi:MAG TPA: hypothetical protein VL475_11795 [Planctomycetaceae bacterium]|nr:hypothetical protein [Planctomycetaceae bacterium]
MSLNLNILLGGLKLTSGLLLCSKALSTSEMAFGLCGVMIGLVPLAWESTKWIMPEAARAEE